MNCQVFTAQAQRAWGYLFSEYDFKILFCQEGEHGSALLFAESPLCRIRFKNVEEFNELDVHFGPRNAPLDWRREESNPLAKESQWFSLFGIMMYLEYNPERVANYSSAVLGKKGETGKYVSLLERWARDARPYLPQILFWFLDDDKYYRFRLAYGNFSAWGGHF